MKIIAFSGLTNTGKSTEIHGNNRYDGIADTLENDGQRCIVYEETARQLFDLLPTDTNEINDLTLFQTAIRAKEQARLFELRKRIEKGGGYTVLVDRTYHDSVLFNQYNRELGLSTLKESSFVDFSHELYDVVVLFTEPHKDNLRLDQYNCGEFKKHFSDGINERYGDKVVQFENNADPKYKEWKKVMFGV